MIIRHFFLDKSNTIYKNSYNNMGLNPILEINYGKRISRGLIHFNECEILDLVKDKTFANLDKLSFRLKMTNCFSVDGVPYEKNLIKGGTASARRAASFDLLLLKLPESFDAGRGFDYESDFWLKENRSVTKHGSSWYFSRDGKLWPSDYSKIDYESTEVNIDSENGKVWIMSGDTRTKLRLEGGIFPKKMLEKEYEQFINGEDSIFIAEQHFDFGQENLDMDITNYVMDIINGEENHGLCLMFSPDLESTRMDESQYVGFFTDHTNTFFHPYIECVYDETISDDRNSFSIGKKNKLYLYAESDGESINLDELPTCTVEGVPYDVEQITKGVYCAEVEGNRSMAPGTLVYDTWSNLKYEGTELDDVEMECEVHSVSKFVKVGSRKNETHEVVPSISGINDGEHLNRHETREVIVDFRRKYTTDIKELIDNATYRLYVKDGNREVTVINSTPIEKTSFNNYFMIYTGDLIPNDYFIDIVVRRGKETLYHKNVLRFRVVSDVTNRYE